MLYNLTNEYHKLKATVAKKLVSVNIEGLENDEHESSRNV